ncbi:unnamed protein product [Polarella glacialis]|uniref:Uncharacterized protein n=1 Tax=Polarella glacialis TaxID=89957 RepID=A0A813LRZ3_POLGL|nr:unnamed protein product [Polarella glacialis]
MSLACCFLAQQGQKGSDTSFPWAARMMSWLKLSCCVLLVLMIPVAAIFVAYALPLLEPASAMAIIGLTAACIVNCSICWFLQTSSGHFHLGRWHHSCKSSSAEAE